MLSFSAESIITTGVPTLGDRFVPTCLTSTLHSIITVVALSGVNNSTSISTDPTGKIMSTVNLTRSPTLVSVNMFSAVRLNATSEGIL